jgi:hypothetical protein
MGGPDQGISGQKVHELDQDSWTQFSQGCLVAPSVAFTQVPWATHIKALSVTACPIHASQRRILEVEAEEVPRLHIQVRGHPVQLALLHSSDSRARVLKSVFKNR